MAIEIRTQQERPIDVSQLPRLFKTAFWGHNRTPEGLAEVLGRSVAVGAWDGGRLVGLVRSLTDGRYRAYIEDVIIAPDYRGQHIGERLVAAMVESLADVEIVSLFCEPERVPFYEKNGFRASETQVMMHRGEEK